MFPYRQVIDAYPGGGGAYAVSLDNFGPRVSLIAAAALVVDYTLTRALRYRPDVVVARVPVRVHVHGRAAGRYQPGGCARP